MDFSHQGYYCYHQMISLSMAESSTELLIRHHSLGGPSGWQQGDYVGPFPYGQKRDLSSLEQTFIWDMDFPSLAIMLCQCHHLDVWDAYSPS